VACLFDHGVRHSLARVSVFQRGSPLTDEFGGGSLVGRPTRTSLFRRGDTPSGNVQLHPSGRPVALRRRYASLGNDPEVDGPDEKGASTLPSGCNGLVNCVRQNSELANFLWGTAGASLGLYSLAKTPKSQREQEEHNEFVRDKLDEINLEGTQTQFLLKGCFRLFRVQEGQNHEILTGIRKFLESQQITSPVEDKADGEGLADGVRKSFFSCGSNLEPR